MSAFCISYKSSGVGSDGEGDGGVEVALFTFLGVSGVFGKPGVDIVPLDGGRDGGLELVADPGCDTEGLWDVEGLGNFSDDIFKSTCWLKSLGNNAKNCGNFFR